MQAVLTFNPGLMLKPQQHEGELRCTTCVVVRRALVDGGLPVGVDDPLGSPAVLRGPAAEGRVVKVAGEPDVR